MNDSAPVVVDGPGRPVGLIWDGAGLILVAGFAGWVLFASAGIDGARPGPVVALLAGCVVAVGFGRLGARLTPRLFPVAVVAAVAALLAGAWDSLHRPAGEPLGYANANAHLAALGLVAVLGALVGLNDARPGSWLGVAARWWACTAVCVAGVGLAVAMLPPDSAAAATFLILAVVGAVAALWWRRDRLALVAGVAVLLLALATTLVIAVGADPVGMGTQTEARGELWAGALDMARDNPWRGIGPGQFAEQNPVTDDVDLRWAHHGYLQVAAELGVPGLLLGLGLLAWAYGRLWVMGSVFVARRVVGTAAVTFLALHATVDYVLHFGLLVLTAAALVGWATGGGRPGLTADPKEEGVKGRAPEGVATLQVGGTAGSAAAGAQAESEVAEMNSTTACPSSGPASS